MCERCESEESVEIMKGGGVSDSHDTISLTVGLSKKGRLDASVGLGIGYDGDRYHNSFYTYVKIKYCPFCGRELERRKQQRRQRKGTEADRKQVEGDVGER
jgi:hypothetical protein